MKRIVTAAISIMLVAVLCVGCASPEEVERIASSASQPDVVINQPVKEDPRLLTAVGTAESVMTPEYAVFMCDIAVTAATADEVTAGTGLVLEAIRTAFDSSAEAVLGMPKTDTVTETDSETGTEVVVSYTNTTPVTITIRDLDGIEQKLTAAIAAGAAGDLKLVFRQPALIDEYMAQTAVAVENAQRLAVAMAEASGVTLSAEPYSIRSISEQPTADSVAFVIDPAAVTEIVIPSFAVRASVELVYTIS